MLIIMFIPIQFMQMVLKHSSLLLRDNVSHATLEKEMTGVPPMLNVDYMIDWSEDSF